MQNLQFFLTEICLQWSKWLSPFNSSFRHRVEKKSFGSFGFELGSNQKVYSIFNQVLWCVQKFDFDFRKFDFWSRYTTIKSKNNLIFLNFPAKNNKIDMIWPFEYKVSSNNAVLPKNRTMWGIFVTTNMYQ